MRVGCLLMGDGACFSRCSRTPTSYYAGHQPDLTFLREVADQLQVIPATIVHGDLWTGNIAIAQVDRTIRLVDWGDALWGVAGISIVHLLLTAQGTLDEASSAIWNAYGSGLGTHIKPAYRATCTIANLVTGLVTDMEIARCCGRGLELLPGLLAQLRSLEALALGDSVNT
jgi:hypothetical protein